MRGAPTRARCGVAPGVRIRTEYSRDARPALLGQSPVFRGPAGEHEQAVVRRGPNEVTELRQPLRPGEQLVGAGIVQSESCGRQEIDRVDRAVPEADPFVVLV